MYKIVFIDEEQDSLDYFEEYVEKFASRNVLEVVVTFPLPTLEEMVEFFIDITPDAIITDYRLNEKKEDIEYIVPYNGVDLVNEYQSIRKGFPCFVLTAVDDEAVSQSDDVNIVYIKDILHNPEEGNAKAKFLDRVISQIKHYKVRISKAETELLDLIAVRKAGDANLDVENRIIELDNYLEKSIDAGNSLPAEFKKLSNIDKLDSMINKVDELLKKIDQKNGK